MQFEQIATGFAFLEAPRIADNGDLYFTDVMRGGVYRRTPDGRMDSFLTERKWIGGLALTENGGVVCGGGGGLVLLDPRTGKTRTLVSEVEGKAILSINDIQPDAAGGIYCGVLDLDSLAAGKPPTDGYIFRIDPSGRAVRAWDGISITNGMGFSPDGRWLYHAETFVGVWEYEVAGDYSLKSRRLFAKINDCDGLAVDAEGGVWVAACQSGEIVRYAADGSVERRHRLPVDEVMSLAFGGEDLRDLYVVTATPGVLNLQNKDDAREGGIFRGRSDIPGQRTPKAKF